MATYKVLTEPDELLRKISKPVTEFTARLGELLDDMAETMRLYHGVGLAAVQVGILWRACIVAAEDGVCELVNPTVISADCPQKGEEGCLSLPKVNGSVMRMQEVTVRAQDRTGKFFERKFTGRQAVCAAHEIDHLDGILFTDRMVKSGGSSANKSRIPTTRKQTE